MSDPPRLIMFGPPGAGKGTQAAILSQWLGAPHISTGEVLRREISEATELGKQAESYVKDGALVPDNLLVSIVRERLVGSSAVGWILDGFPRTISQARFLSPVLSEIGQPLSLVICLDVPRPVVVDRLIERQAKEGREDDSEATILRRLDVYESQTLPVLKLYDDEGKLVRVDGNRPLEEVTVELKECLQIHLAL